MSFLFQSICFSATQGVEMREGEDMANCSQSNYLSGIVSLQEMVSGDR